MRHEIEQNTTNDVCLSTCSVAESINTVSGYKTDSLKCVLVP
jgi:hypothetical protein